MKCVASFPSRIGALLVLAAGSLNGLAFAQQQAPATPTPPKAPAAPAATPAAPPAPSTPAAKAQLPSAAVTVKQLANPATASDAEWKIARDYPASETIPLLIVAIQTDPDFALGTPAREAAFTALSRAGEAKVGQPRPDDARQIEQLLAGLVEPAERTRATCARTLGFVQPARRPAMKQPLVERLADPSSFVVASALEALRLLALAEPAPAEVWAIAKNPTPEVREKWAKGQIPQNVPAGSPYTEVMFRMGAMTVIATWEGFPRLYAPEMRLDATGKTARAAASAIQLNLANGRVELADEDRMTMLSELVAFYTEDEMLPSHNRIIITALAAAANNSSTVTYREAAKAAIRQCAERTTGDKQALAQQVLTSNR